MKQGRRKLRFIEDQLTPQERWRRVAVEKRAWAEYLSSRGEYSPMYYLQADLADRTAAALDLEEQHGEPYCSCHLQPLRLMQNKDRMCR